MITKVPQRPVTFFNTIVKELREKGIVVLEINSVPETYRRVPSNLVAKLRTRAGINTIYETYHGFLKIKLSS